MVINVHPLVQMINSELKYEINKILNEKERNASICYLIKWIGY